MQQCHGGRAGFQHQRPVNGHVAFFQSLCHVQHALIFRIEVHCAQERTVRYAAAQRRERSPERCGWDFAQHAAAEAFRNGAHFRGDVGIFLREPCMASAGVDDEKRVPVCGKIAGELADFRMLRIFEIDAVCAAERGSSLIHQPAGFAEECVFGELPCLCKLHRRDGARVEQRVVDRAEQHLERGGGGEPAALRHIGNEEGIEASGTVSTLPECGSNAAQQRRRCARFLRDGRKGGKRGGAFSVAFREKAHYIRAVRPYCGNEVERNSCSKYAAVLVVGMVAAKLRAAGRADERHGRSVEAFRKAAENAAAAFCLKRTLLRIQKTERFRTFRRGKVCIPEIHGVHCRWEAHYKNLLARFF